MSNNNFKSLHLLYASTIFVVILAGPGCKKDKEDTSLPVITIHAPSTIATFDYLDDIPIRASVSDNNKLISVTIEITNGQSEKFLQDITYRNNDASLEINTFATHNDEFLEAGVYYVKVSASDGTNDNSVYQEIHLSEAPVILKKTYLLNNSSNIVNVDALSDGVLSPFTSLFGQSDVAAIDSRYGIVAMGNPAYDAVLRIEPFNFTVTTISQTFAATSGQEFKCITVDEKDHEIFIGTSEPKIISLDHNGLFSTAITLDDYFLARHIATSDNFIYVHEQNVQQTVQKISVYHKGTGSFFHSTLVDYDVKGMITLDDDHVLIAGNTIGASQFEVFNNTTGFLNDVFSFYDPSVISGIWPGLNGEFYVAHAAGIVRYNNDIEMMTSATIALNPLSVKVEKLSGLVYAVTYEGVHILNTNATEEIDFLPKENSREILFWYNK